MVQHSCFCNAYISISQVMLPSTIQHRASSWEIYQLLPSKMDDETGDFKGLPSPSMSWKNNLKVLLVDPSSTCTLIAKAHFSNCGVTAEAVGNAEVALTMLNKGASFTLIIVDMYPREMNGVQFARRLRSMGVQTRLLGMSTLFKQLQKEEFLAAGGDGFIEKPLHPSKFIPILQDLVNNFQE